MAGKKNNKINPFIMVLICAVLLYVALNSMSTLALGLWGEDVIGTVDYYHSRLEERGAATNRSRTVFKGYYFFANGREYRGRAAYASDEAWPTLGENETRPECISYFSFCPYINKPCMLTDFSQMGDAALLYHFFAPIGCLLLLLLVTGKLKRKKRSRKSAAGK